MVDCGHLQSYFRGIAGKYTHHLSSGLSRRFLFNDIYILRLFILWIIVWLAATGTEEDAADEPSHKPTAIPLRNEAALLVDPVMKISPDLVSFSCKGTLLAASVWVRPSSYCCLYCLNVVRNTCFQERLGMNHMADFSYRRYLRQFGLCSASEDILQIFCKMIFVKLDILCCSWRWRSSSSTSSSSSQRLLSPESADNNFMRERIRENLLSSVKEVRQLLAKIHSIFPDKESYSVKIQESLSVCRHYSLALEAMMKGDWQRSTRLASQLVQMTGRGAADARSGWPLQKVPPNIRRKKTNYFLQHDESACRHVHEQWRTRRRQQLCLGDPPEDAHLPGGAAAIRGSFPEPADLGGDWEHCCGERIAEDKTRGFNLVSTFFFFFFILKEQWLMLATGTSFASEYCSSKRI